MIDKKKQDGSDSLDELVMCSCYAPDCVYKKNKICTFNESCPDQITEEELHEASKALKEAQDNAISGT